MPSNKRTRKESVTGRNRQPASPANALDIRSSIIPLSLILFVAGLVQIVAGLIKVHILSQTILPPPQSTLIANRYYFDQVFSLFLDTSADEPSGLRLEYIVCLLIALFSSGIVYIAARRWLGSSWALAAGLIYVICPGFAWFIPDAGALALLTFMIPSAWLLLLWWDSGQYPVPAFLLGFGLAIISLINFTGLLLLILAIIGMFLHQPFGRRVLIGVLVMLIGYALLLWPARERLSSADRMDIEATMVKDLCNVIDNGDGSAIAKAARLSKTSPHPVQFLWMQTKNSPANVIGWVLNRAWNTLYSVSDIRMTTLVGISQIAWLIPAAWGLLTALIDPSRRWASALAGGLMIIPWAMAALVEPMARNLTPILGIALIFSLTGIRDLYHCIARRRALARARRADQRRR